jgi:hypothetical protein
LRFYHPEKKPKTRTPKPGTVLWVVQKGSRTLRRELRDDSRVGAGFDVQVFEDDFLVFAQRCPIEGPARFLAATVKG